MSSTPPGEYTNEIPGYLLAYAHSRNIIENNIDNSTSIRNPPESPGSMTEDQPPTLPPHLEKVLLNSSAVSKEDNSVLPVPNHVVLNHLYACSIRDGVMAVAGTARYRKKVIIFTSLINSFFFNYICLLYNLLKLTVCDYCLLQTYIHMNSQHVYYCTLL